MAYRFKHGESVAEGAKRVAREQIESAIKCLGDNTGAADGEKVHEARKRIKKVRALLRLVRPGLGPAYSVENRRLRDAGRKLSKLRDAVAVIEAFDEFQRRASGSVPQRTLALIRRDLVLQKQRVEERLATPGVKNEVAAALAESLQSIDRRPLKQSGFAVLESGLEQTFRAGKKAFARARDTGRRQDVHEWRKRVKDHWYHVRLLDKLWSDVMEEYSRSLENLQSTLGEDLNLALLRDRLASTSGPRETARNTHLVTKAINSARKELRADALAIGDKVYSRKPREFTREIRRLWDSWRAQPRAAA